MGLKEILARDDVPPDVKKVITNLEEQLETYRNQFEELVTRRAKDFGENEQLYQALFDNTPEAVILHVEGKITDLNKPALKTLGVTTPDQVLGKSVMDFVHPSYREILKKQLQHLNEDKVANKPLKQKILQLDGSEVAVEALSIPVMYKGKSAGFVVAHDITDRRQMKKAVKESERKLQTIMDVIQTGIVIIDALSHRIVDVNSMAINMIGAPKEDIISSECHKFICPAERGQCPICDLGQKVDQSERILLRAGGEKIPILKTVNTVILDEQMYIVESFIDITELKQTEELMRIQRDLGVVLSSTSNLMETLDLILNAALKIKEIDSGGIYLIDKDTEDLHLAHSKGLGESFVENVSHIEANDPRAKLVMKGEPVYAPFKQVVPSADKTQLKEDILFLGVIPVPFEEKVVAVLNVASHSAEKISRHTQSTLEAVVTQIGPILELKEAEEALRESKEKYQMLVEKLEEGVLLEDAEGLVSFVNPKTVEMLGSSMEEIIGQHWSILVPEDYLDLT
ncbi:MAG: PAS domain S-box protein, partial [Candidatus Hodarchaeales archaeon]